MKATETKSTHSQQHSAEMASPAQTMERGAFFSGQAVATPFFQAASIPGGQARTGPRQSFFHSGRVAQVQRKCDTCKTEEVSTESPLIQRMPAFESDGEGTAQTKPIQAKPLQAKSLATKPLIQRQTEPDAELEEDAGTEGEVQAKLTIGAPDDPFEQEADAVADQVATMPKQRDTLAPGVQTKPLSKTITRLSRRPGVAVRPKRLMRLAKTARRVQKRVQKQGEGGTTASSDVASRLSSSRGGGSALDDNTRTEMESSIGADFSNVRIHTGSEASQLSQDLQAKAFTHGSDIYFNQGQYNPNSSDGKHLLAHELTHTVQQGASIQRKVNISANKAPSVQLFFGAIKRAAIRKFKQGLNYLAERIIPGYSLLNVFLGKNLITDEIVIRSGVNLIKGYMRLSPVIGSILLNELEQAKSLPEAGKWVEGKVAEFGINFDDIAERLKLMWNEMSITRGIKGNIGIFRKYIGPVIGKIKAFSGVVMEKVKELRFEGALRLVGATELLTALKKNPKAFKKAVDDPKTVLKQFMVGALKKGFSNFRDNFVTHFKAALLGWLFGKAAQMGIQMPKKLTVAGLFSLIAQLVGATYQQIRAMVVKRLGPKGEMIVSRLEQTVTLIKDLVTKGPIVLWERVKSFLTDLKEMVFSKIATLVSTEIIKTAVTKLLSMLNPAGAIMQLALSLYRVIKFFIDNWETIKSVASGILNAIGMVALNKIGPAAKFVETVLAKGMKLIIGFLARIFGLGGIVEKVKVLIKKISNPVQEAIGKVIDWIVAQGKKLLRKFKKAAKRAKKKLVQWWKKKRTFKTSIGKSHTLAFKGKGKKARLEAHSSEPITIVPVDELQKYLNRLQDKDKPEPHLQDELLMHAKILTDLLLEEDTVKKTENVSTRMIKIEKILEKSNLLDPVELPPTKVVWKMNKGRAGEVIAAPVTLRPGNTKGDEDTTALNGSDGDFIKENLVGENNKVLHARAHLLNGQKLHGPNIDWNLAATTKSVNSRMHKAEIPAKLYVKNKTEIRWKAVATYFSNNRPSDKTSSHYVDDLLKFLVAQSIDVTLEYKDPETGNYVKDDKVSKEYAEESFEALKLDRGAKILKADELFDAYEENVLHDKKPLNEDDETWMRVPGQIKMLEILNTKLKGTYRSVQAQDLSNLAAVLMGNGHLRKIEQKEANRKGVSRGLYIKKE